VPQAAVPDDIDDEIAAQIFITTLTVVGMVETAAVPQVSRGHICGVESNPAATLELPRPAC
jgi:hypothetical protein